MEISACESRSEVSAPDSPVGNGVRSALTTTVSAADATDSRTARASLDGTLAFASAAAKPGASTRTRYSPPASPLSSARPSPRVSPTAAAAVEFRTYAVTRAPATTAPCGSTTLTWRSAAKVNGTNSRREANNRRRRDMSPPFHAKGAIGFGSRRSPGLRRTVSVSSFSFSKPELQPGRPSHGFPQWRSASGIQQLATNN